MKVIVEYDQRIEDAIKAVKEENRILKIKLTKAQAWRDHYKYLIDRFGDLKGWKKVIEQDRIDFYKSLESKK